MNSIDGITTTVLKSPATAIIFTPSSVTANGVVCGSVTYTLSPTTYSFITLDSTTRTITVNPTLSSQISTYPMTVIASLVSYPTAATQSLNFNVIVNACVVTSLTVASNPWNPALTLTVNIEDPAGIIIPFTTFTQTPACGYSVSSTTLLADTIPATGALAYSWLT